jgi:hypothetical protein
MRAFAISAPCSQLCQSKSPLLAVQRGRWSGAAPFGEPAAGEKRPPAHGRQVQGGPPFSSCAHDKQEFRKLKIPSVIRQSYRKKRSRRSRTGRAFGPCRFDYNAGVRFHLPAWVQTVAAIGGFGFIFKEILKPMFTSLRELFLNRHDAPVWAIVREPRFKVHHTQGDRKFFDYNVELPYSVKEVADKTHRSESSILGSLKRLETRGKVKDIHGGWQRKEK